MSDGYEYRIERANGTVVETTDLRFAVEVMWHTEQEEIEEPRDHTKLEPDHVPKRVQRRTPDGSQGRLYRLHDLFRERAGDPKYDDAARDAYREGAGLVGDIIEGRSFP